MKQRITALLLAAVLFAAICPAVLAEGGEGGGTMPTAKEVSISVSSPILGTGIVYIPITITNMTDAPVSLDSVTSKNGLFSNITFTKEDELNTVESQRSRDILLTATLSTAMPGTYADLLSFKLSNNEKKTANVTLTIPEMQPQTSPEPGKATAAFRLSSFDANGLIVPTAAGKNGGKVQVRLPLLCVDGPVSNIKAVPKLSTSLDEFPFAIEQVDYTIGYNGMIGVNQIIEFQFNLRFADKVTAGVKKVDFTITYDRGWASATGDSSESCDISLYVNVTRAMRQRAASLAARLQPLCPK